MRPSTSRIHEIALDKYLNNKNTCDEANRMVTTGIDPP